VDDRAPIALELSLGANPHLVSPVRCFLEQALKSVVTDADFVDRVAMAAHELLENATKYSADDAVLKLSLVLDGATGRDVVLRVSNVAQAAHLQRLRRFLAEINEAADPMILYLDMMARDPFDTTVSGLGLARIRAEAAMFLDLMVENEMVTLTART